MYITSICGEAWCLNACCGWLRLLSYDWTTAVQGRILENSQLSKDQRYNDVRVINKRIKSTSNRCIVLTGCVSYVGRVCVCFSVQLCVRACESFVIIKTGRNCQTEVNQTFITALWFTGNACTRQQSTDKHMMIFKAEWASSAYSLCVHRQQCVKLVQVPCWGSREIYAKPPGMHYRFGTVWASGTCEYEINPTDEPNAHYSLTNVFIWLASNTLLPYIMLNGYK